LLMTSKPIELFTIVLSHGSALLTNGTFRTK
jgi:hypothetical protein